MGPAALQPAALHPAGNHFYIQAHRWSYTGGGGRGGCKIRSGAGCKRKPRTRLGGGEIRPGSAGGPGGVISVLQSLLQD